MLDNDTQPSRTATCTPRRADYVRHHLLHYFGAGHAWLVSGSQWAPPVDLYETAREFVLEVNLAGIAPDDVHVEIRHSAVVLSGERLERDGSDTRCYHVLEIERGTFRRTVELPVPVDTTTARATSEHGLLVVRVAKRTDEPIAGCSSSDTMEGLE